MASVLLAIHDRERRQALHEALVSSSFAPRQAATLEQALAISARHRVDIALIDAGFDGFCVLAATLRSEQPEPRPLVVRLTGETAAPETRGRHHASLSTTLPAVDAVAFIDRLASWSLRPAMA